MSHSRWPPRDPRVGVPKNPQKYFTNKSVVSPKVVIIFSFIGLEGKSPYGVWPYKPEICKTKFTTQTTKTNNKIVVFPCPPQGLINAKYSTLASFVRDARKPEVITFFKDAFDLLLDTLDDDTASVKEWCFSTSNGTTGWVQGIIDSNSNACYTT